MEQMNYINRKDGGRYSDRLDSTQLKAGRTFIFGTLAEAERFAEGKGVGKDQIKESYGSYKIEI